MEKTYLIKKETTQHLWFLYEGMYVKLVPYSSLKKKSLSKKQNIKLKIYTEISFSSFIALPELLCNMRYLHREHRISRGYGMRV